MNLADPVVKDFLTSAISDDDFCEANQYDDDYDYDIFDDDDDDDNDDDDGYGLFDLKNS